MLCPKLRGAFLGSRYGKKGPIFSGWRYVKGVLFQGKECERGTFLGKDVWKSVPIFQNLVFERVRGPDVGLSIYV